MPTAPSPETSPPRSICVFCGSSSGTDPDAQAAADAIGRAIAGRGLGLVYGGGSAGLMGAVATGALAVGGHVVGVLPAGLFPDGVTASPYRPEHAGTLVIEEVADMHARKARFAVLSDAFVALPGGLGTLEELAEVATWAQIGIHTKPLGLLNVNGYYDGLLAWIDRAVADGFVPPHSREALVAAGDVDSLLEAVLARATSPST